MSSPEIKSEHGTAGVAATDVASAAPRAQKRKAAALDGTDARGGGAVVPPETAVQRARRQKVEASAAAAAQRKVAYAQRVKAFLDCYDDAYKHRVFDALVKRALAMVPENSAYKSWNAVAFCREHAAALVSKLFAEHSKDFYDTCALTSIQDAHGQWHAKIFLFLTALVTDGRFACPAGLSLAVRIHSNSVCVVVATEC